MIASYRDHTGFGDRAGRNAGAVIKQGKDHI